MEAVHIGITEDELMALGSDARVEVINGQIVEKPAAGFLHHVVLRNLWQILDLWCGDTRGVVFFDGLLFLLKHDGGNIESAQMPDLAFIRLDNVPHDLDLYRSFAVAPDLAVEVVSPDETAELLLLRTRKYLEAGTEQVWVVYPESRELHQYRRGDSADTVRVYRQTDTVDVDALFPGLMLRMVDIFRLPSRVSRQTDAE